MPGPGQTDRETSPRRPPKPSGPLRVLRPAVCGLGGGATTNCSRPLPCESCPGLFTDYLTGSTAPAAKHPATDRIHCGGGLGCLHSLCDSATLRLSLPHPSSHAFDRQREASISPSPSLSPRALVAADRSAHAPDGLRAMAKRSLELNGPLCSVVGSTVRTGFHTTRLLSARALG